MEEKILEMMDSAFFDYSVGKYSRDTFEERFAKIISSLPLKKKKNFTVSIINEKNREPFFGFRIFPISSSMDEIANIMADEKISFKELYKRWSNIDSWYMEIDANVFSKTLCNFTPKELTAMTLHEIGHTIYSDKFLVTLYNAFKEARVRMKIADKSSLKVLYSLYMVPLSIGCMQRAFVNSKNEVEIEYYADRVLTKYGYTDSLLSALDKVIKAYGSQNQSNTSKMNDIVQSIQWCDLNIIDLNRRKEKLKDELYYQSLKNESHYFKAICFQILNKFGVRLRERYTGTVVECTLDIMYQDSRYGDDKVPCMEYYKLILDPVENGKILKAWDLNKSHYGVHEAIEGIFGSRNRKNKKIKLPSTRQFDEIDVQINYNITNYHDKLFILDQIYDLSDQIDLYEEIYQDDPNIMKRDSGKISEYRKKLAKLRAAVLQQPLPDNELKLFVKYPKGYEG